MIVLRELIYFIGALFLLEVLMCLLMVGGDCLNEMHKHLYGVDIIALLKAKRQRRKMIYSNDFKGKKEMVKDLAEIYKRIKWSDIHDIELKKYHKNGLNVEFVVLTWDNGAISTANNALNSLSATARNVARMLDGGVYENLDLYKEVMSSDEWVEEK